MDAVICFAARKIWYDSVKDLPIDDGVVARSQMFQAIMVAAVCEFLGASLLGAGVTGESTFRIFRVPFRSLPRQQPAISPARAFPIRVSSSSTRACF